MILVVVKTKDEVGFISSNFKQITARRTQKLLIWCIYMVYLVVICVDEDDIATYTIKSVDDPRALNKSLYIRPPQNILSQNEVIQLWEKHIGKELKKSSLSKDDFLAMKKGI